MSSSAQKVSFTVRRPTPVSRATSSGPDSDSGSSFKVPSLPRHLVNESTPGSPLARSNTSSPRPYTQDLDSDEEDEEDQDELVTGFDQFGVERLKPKKAPQGPLVIPALKNRDWREAARRRRTVGQFVPESARAQKTGSDGSVGGLGTKDTINIGPVLSGLQIRKKEEFVKLETGDAEMEEVSIKKEEELVAKVEETEDQRALRALLSEANGEVVEGPQIGVIPALSEADAYKQDVDELPESATLDDYSRVPVSQFGAAMLRGMGWKEGTAASRKGQGMIQPYIPEARPALLGIGAKEMEVFDDGSNHNHRGNKRPERRYVPVVKKDKDGNIIDDKRGDNNRNRDKERRRERSTSPRRESRVSSRRSSPDGRSSSRRDREYGYDRDRDRESDRDRKRDKERDRERGREKSDRSYRRDSERRRDDY